MRRRIFSFLVLIFIMLEVLSINFVAEALTGSVIFLDADKKIPINEITNSKNIQAEINFVAQKTGKANIITAGYDDEDKMITIPVVETVDMTTDKEITHRTASFSVNGVDKFKVFVWEQDNISPVLDQNGVINTFFSLNNFSEKFTPLNGEEQSNPLIVPMNKSISISKIFDEVYGAVIYSKYFDLKAQTVGGGTADVDFTPDTINWKNGTVKFNSEGLLKLTVQDYSFCSPTNMYVNVIAPFDRYSKVFKNTDSYIYRVGNSNAVKLSSLFEAIETDIPVSNMQATITNVNGNANGVFTKNADWGESTIKFSGTGVVEVTISDEYSNPVSLLLEVVAGKNVTQYSQMSSTGNVVMLNDINIDSGAQFKLNSSTLYGNGFNFDVTDGTYTSKNDLSNYLIQLNSSILDNVKVIGAVYTAYGETASTNYNNCVVLSTGNSTIANSYISNCAAPVRVHNGNINITNTTLKGGNFSNLDIRNGNVTLENVTTINQADLNDKSTDGKIVVGLGITVYYEYADNTTKININGNFTQYNHLSQNDEEYIIPSRLNSMFDSIFRYNDLVYTDENGVKWISTGILSMSDQVTDDNVTDIEGYLDESPTAFGSTGYLHAPSKRAPADASEYVTVGQYAIAPTYKFDYTTKNYIPKATGSNDFCYYSNGTVMISFDDGESFEWDTSILTATKVGQTIPYTVSMNGVDYTGKKITFDQPGDYTITYTYTDPYNYNIGKNNNISLFDKTYTQNVYINVTEVMPDSKNAEFTFGSSNIPSTMVMVGNETYVMPADTSLKSTTVSGQKIYCPTVEMFTSDGKWEHSSLNPWYACFPVFDGAVTITDYDSNGEEVVYNSSTKELPTGLSVPGDPTKVFQYGATATAPAVPSVYNDVLCYTSSKLSNNERGEINIFAKYKYTDNAGATYFYYINYHCKPVTVSSSCVTGDSLVTLADGSKKRVDVLSYDDEVLAWDFYNGTYTTAPVSLIINHGYSENEIISLIFDDETTIDLVNVHGMFNKTLNEFVDISSDNVKNFVGDIFYKSTDNGFAEVKLIDFEIKNEFTSSYSLLSAYHYNVILNDMLTASPSLFIDNLYEPFEIGEDMKYDEEKMKEDITKYGFSEYEEFSEYLTKEQFEMLRVENAKILIGKGYATYESIIEMLKAFAIPYV